MKPYYNINSSYRSNKSISVKILKIDINMPKKTALQFTK